MATITGRTWNHDGSRRWPGTRVLLINESTGAKEQEVVSDDMGNFEFTVASALTVYTCLGKADDARSGARSGITGV